MKAVVMAVVRSRHTALVVLAATVLFLGVLAWG